MSEHTKIAGDWIAGVVSVAAIAALLPPLAALFTIIYTCLRIYEWFEKRHKRKAP